MTRIYIETPSGLLLEYVVWETPNTAGAYKRYARDCGARVVAVVRPK